MLTRSLWAVVVALAFLLPPSFAEGQAVPAAERGPWEILGFAGGFDDRPEFDPDGHSWFIHPDKNIQFGAGLNYHLPWAMGPFGIFVGLEGRYVPLDIRPQMGPQAGTLTDLDAFFGSGLIGLNLPLHNRFDLYGVAGPTVARWRPERGTGDWDPGLTYGGGAKLYVLDNLALFGDFRMFQIPKAMQDVSRSVTGLTADETFWGYSFSGGLSFFFGTKDSDRDGVPDKHDECPDTPRGVAVDARGCPLDSDGDGVPDYLDECPNTPAGAPVDERGCPLDSDGDGVPDYLDRCPNTPAGVQVDASGCPLDSDGDGVPDYLDRCPDTPRGVQVDRDGCPLPEPEPEVISYTFEDVYFDFDRATLTPEGQARLREIGAILITITDADVEVHGHTDSTGPEDYNMGLSQRRAESVQRFLLENFSQLRADQFTIRAFGETQPVATNDTRDGRALNRRVEIKLITG
jgi:outer membrane protein OmpA-like peptidoglycan-associated protein